MSSRRASTGRAESVSSVGTTATVKDGRVSSDHSWEAGENYQTKAAHVAQLLLEDYARRSGTE